MEVSLVHPIYYQLQPDWHHSTFSRFKPHIANTSPPNSPCPNHPIDFTLPMSCPIFQALNFPPFSLSNPISPNPRNLPFALSAPTPTPLFSLLTRAWLCCCGWLSVVWSIHFSTPYIQPHPVLQPRPPPYHLHCWPLPKLIKKMTSPYYSTPNPALPPCTFCLKYTNLVTTVHLIVSSYGSPTECVSAYINALLLSFVKSFTSHVQDINHPIPAYSPPTWFFGSCWCLLLIHQHPTYHHRLSSLPNSHTNSYPWEWSRGIMKSLFDT